MAQGRMEECRCAGMAVGRHYSVDVAELEGTPCLGRTTELPCLYVGQTSKTPKERYLEQKRGVRAGRGWIMKYGKQLPPDLYEDIEPFGGVQGWAPSVKKEKERAQELSNQGYCVHCN